MRSFQFRSFTHVECGVLGFAKMFKKNVCLFRKGHVLRQDFIATNSFAKLWGDFRELFVCILIELSMGQAFM